VRRLPRVPAEVRTATFPTVGRGYDRRAVDSYVMGVNRLIAEFEATRSPEAVLERAFDRAEAHRESVLRDAHEAAAKIMAAAEQAAEGITSSAGAKAVDLVVTAGDEAERAKADADNHVAKAQAEAEEVLADAVREAANRLARAEDEIESMRKEAESFLLALRNDTHVLWGERGDLLADLREIAARAEQAVARSGVENVIEHDSSR